MSNTFQKPEIITERASFTGATGEISAFIARPDKNRAHPALIVVHEMWGLTEHICDVTRRFARAGHFAVAPDLYSRFGHPVTQDRDTAFKLMDALKIADGIDDLMRTIEWIGRQPNAIADRVAITGFCMGGTYSIEMACERAGLKAAVPFYGQVANDDRLRALRCPILYIGAELDWWAPKEQALRLQAALEILGKAGEVIIYPNVPHAFFNDARPEVYRESEARDAWAKALGFLDRHLKAGAVSPD
jgi:carboxymethylenebutenolidase